MFVVIADHVIFFVVFHIVMLCISGYIGINKMWLRNV